MFRALKNPLEKVVESAQTFIAEADLRLFHVVTNDSMRKAVIRHILAEELHGSNHCPFVILEHVANSTCDGWTACADELRQDMADLQKTHIEAKDGIDIRCMPAAARAKTSLGRFGLELKAALDCIDAPLDGLVIVLAPREVTDAKRWREDVAALIARKELRRARWVVVDIEDPHTQGVVDELGQESAISVDARIDGAAIRSDMDVMLAGIRSASPLSRGMRIAGAAGPDKPPPLRKNLPPPLTREQAEAVAKVKNVPAASLLVENNSKLRSLIVGAANALSNGNAANAVAIQREARKTARKLGLSRVAVMMTLLLGGYAMQAGATETATNIFADARAEAEAEQMPTAAAQAQLAIAASLVMAQKPEDAALAYAEAGCLAANMGAPIMAIEGYRMCGQLLVAQGDHVHAIEAFCKALDIADDAPPIDRGISSAPVAARSLARLCRMYDMAPQADSLEQQANAMERLEHYDLPTAPQSDTPPVTPEEQSDACRHVV